MPFRLIYNLFQSTILINISPVSISKQDFQPKITVNKTGKPKFKCV
jgi:hypothetical protein